MSMHISIPYAVRQLIRLNHYIGVLKYCYNQVTTMFARPALGRQFKVLKARVSELHRETVELLWHTLRRYLESLKTTGIHRVSACKVCCTRTQIKCST